LVRMGQVISLKPERRRRIGDIAHRAIAYRQLTDTCEGFPEVELL
jgi:hypothetical protein